MLHSDDARFVVNSSVLLVFETIHYDKAGETGQTVIAKAEVAEIDAFGTAFLVTEKGIHTQFPVAYLYPAEGSTEREPRWMGGQSVVRDFHNAVQPASLRRMSVEELRKHLAPPAKPSKSRARGRKK